MNKEQFMAISLPYELKVHHFDVNRESEHICRIEIWHNEEITISDGEYEYDLLLNDILPILHPLTDLTRPIEHKGETLIPIDEINNMIDDENLGYNDHYIDYENPDKTGIIDWLNEPFFIVMWLIEHHFDIAGLIEKGEAIDVNTLPENPYK